MGTSPKFGSADISPDSLSFPCSTIPDILPLILSTAISLTDTVIVVARSPGNRLVDVRHFACRFHAARFAAFGLVERGQAVANIDSMTLSRLIALGSLVALGGLIALGNLTTPLSGLRVDSPNLLTFIACACWANDRMTRLFGTLKRRRYVLRDARHLRIAQARQTRDRRFRTHSARRRTTRFVARARHRRQSARYPHLATQTRSRHPSDITAQSRLPILICRFVL